jgi:hypothetical protein
MKYEENFGMTDEQFQTINQVIRRIMGPDNLLICRPKLDQLCYRCRRPMCTVELVDGETNYQCFYCGHKEMKL